MQVLTDIVARTYREVQVVDERLARRMKELMFRISVHHAGYDELTKWHPFIPEGWAEFPQLEVEKGTVCRGTCGRAYNHQSGIAKFGNEYVASWSSGILHEEHPGQEVHFATSLDGLSWSAPAPLVTTSVESGIVRNNAGLYVGQGELYCYVCVAQNLGRDGAEPGMSVLKDPRFVLDVYQTSDLKNWTHHPAICGNIYLFEGPRMTREGKLMCCGYDYAGDGHAILLIWDDPSDPAGRPREVHIPLGTQGVLPEQGTWYQTDDGRIWLWLRDGSFSCRLGLCWSDDGGNSWSDITRTNFPNSYSRAFAGRLNDGRYYIVGNNCEVFLDRRYLLIALSDDGVVFDRQYLLAAGETTRRIDGRHKEDGWHYPNCIVDGDRLLVVHSVNKEDIEVLAVDMGAVD